MNKQQSKREIQCPGSQQKTQSNVLPFLPETGIEHVDSTTIVEKSVMTAEQRALFMEAYADAVIRAEGEEDEKILDFKLRADFDGVREHVREAEKD